jgi:hypothetical protein
MANKLTILIEGDCLNLELLYITCSDDEQHHQQEGAPTLTIQRESFSFLIIYIFYILKSHFPFIVPIYTKQNVLYTDKTFL